MSLIYFKRARANTPVGPLYSEATSFLRVGVRLAHGSYSLEVAHPALVDGESHLAVLLNRKAHRVLLHASPQVLLDELRQQNWTKDGPRSVQRVIGQCTTCRRFMAKAEVPGLLTYP